MQLMVVLSIPIGMYVQYYITSCIFRGNNATNGGAIYHENGLAMIKFSSFYNNTAELLGDAISCWNGIVTAEYNWWGSNADPSEKVAAVTIIKWLVLTATANPTTINLNGTSTITADLLHDSSGVYHDPIYGHVPDGIPVNFTTNLGTLTNPVTTVNGTAQSTLKGISGCC